MRLALRRGLPKEGPFPVREASISPSDPSRAAPARQRSQGQVGLSVGLAGGASRIRDLAESGPSRLRFPKVAGGAPEAVLVNTAGGIACGDRFTVSAEVGEGAALVFTTTAAEKIYRSDGPVSRIENHLRVGAGGRIDWLPQETILYDQARLARRFEADLGAGAALLACEILVLGRAARGETVAQGLVEDQWRIRRQGRLAYADSLRLEGELHALMRRPAIGGGARALATLIDLAPGAEARLDEARALLDDPAVEAGASAWNGHLALRLLAADADALRRLCARFLTAWRGAPLPRVWQS
ncbi:urease accessory protein UreD [Methylobacterium organophilum]|uniref:Urease accessory protein UreD n=1 Tax=Methylobacterium organophilum TaxID=410 RepID=A0ABQ4TDC4_METOR|nr:urease accessory protein UreD [Methylobacterium organophilum]UMY17322.1 urease accessory protein UreD [Methylobacterium organophilum]GJE29293.1 Urease accessory protein UreD [Methylobacterium organophilum]